jgi:sulfite reductase (NADPH) flavoprotein alpha-component
MPTPQIPENAPFSPSQRAWLNGFFAGLVSTGQVGPAHADAAVNGHASTNGDATGALNDASASEQTDAAEPASQRATSWREVQDDDPDQYPWHDPDMSIDDRMELVKDQPLELKLMGAMAQLDCGQCGYLCRTYAKAIETGEETDLKRCVPGGKQTSKMVKRILSEHESASDVNGTDNAPPSAAATGSDNVATAAASGPASDGDTSAATGVPAHDRDHPFPAPMVTVQRLTTESSNKDTHFVSLSLAGSGIAYNVGDSLGVYPKNPYERVDALIKLLQCSGAEPITLNNGASVTFRQALIEHCDIKNPSDELYELLATYATKSEEAEDLRRCIDEEEVAGLIEDPRVIDVLARFPSARPQPQELVSALDALQPRLYSIASSPQMHPEEVHLVVGAVRYEQQGQPRKGVASTYLADRIVDREPVPVFIQPSHDFNLPEDDSTDIIMVGPGTGIAPFRAFLEHRHIAGATGRNWLFFGEQHQASEFLFEEELAQYQAEGTLTHLTTAFSRDQAERVYVQHRMLDHAAELWQWLKDGACFYVCGDASRMAGDVDRALHQITAEHGQMTEESAKDYIARMKKAGRYQRDVY